MVLNIIGWLLVKFRHVLILMSMNHVYFHLPGYMNRWWLFNGYNHPEHIPKYPWIKFSIRIHHILREDLDVHMHDHPCNARSFILKGWYVEEREDGNNYIYYEGDTNTLKFGEYHRIINVSPGGIWTLFILGPKLGEWGFKVNNKKILWYEYLNEPINEIPIQKT
jgi:hypothetical protein